MLSPTLSRSLGFIHLSSAGKFRKSIANFLARRWHQPSLIVKDLLLAVGVLTWILVGIVVWLAMWMVGTCCRTVVRGWRILRWSTQPRHALGSLLMLTLLCSSTPAAPQTIVSVAKESSVSFLFWSRASGLAKLLQGQGIGNARGQEKQADRDAKVSRLQIFPGDVTIHEGEQVSFAAAAYDKDDNPVGGVSFTWSAKDEDRISATRISPRGDFEAKVSGNFKVTVEAAGRKASVKVKVLDGDRRRLTDKKPGAVRSVSNRDNPSTSSSLNLEKDRRGQRGAPASKKPVPQTVQSVVSDRRSAHASRHTGAAPSPMFICPPDDGWNDCNYRSSSDPGNRRGDPPGGAMDGGAGSGNFQVTAPAGSWPGRGINIAIGLSGNTRLWNKAGSQITFDIDRDWPAPGWSLGFGKLLGMGVYNGGMLVDADGTRHSYAGTITPYNWGTTFVGHTTDGSFIDYNYQSGTGGPIVWAQAKLANGTVVQYGAMSTAAVYPTSILDANGNYITITYVNNTGPRIQTVTDTMGRLINFSYDPNNLLTAITAPELGGGTRTLVRFHYRQLSLSYGFAWPQIQNVVVRDPYPWVIDAIYYPATNTGYWLGDGDSYSSYGMIAKVVEQRGMGFSAASLNDQGTVTPGQTTSTESYNYPLTPDYSLTDAPTYTSMTEIGRA